MATQTTPNTGQTIVDLANQVSPTVLTWIATLTGKPVQSPTTATVQAAAPAISTGVLLIGLGVLAFLVLKK